MIWTTALVGISLWVHTVVNSPVPLTATSIVRQDASVIFVAIVLLAWASRATYDDLNVVPRRHARAPDRALLGAFHALRLSRWAYFFAALSPDARTRSATPTSLGPIPIENGDFTLRTARDVVEWAYCFAHATFAIRKIVPRDAQVLSNDGQVAIVRIELEATRIPAWVLLVSTLAATSAVIRSRYVLVITSVAFLLPFIFRRRHRFTVRKTMLRGPNGLWYLLDPNLRDDASR